MKEATQIIHSIPVDELTGAISVPIYQTSTFVQDAPGINKGFDYSRSNNPTRLALEKLAAKIENGHSGYAFSSGLAAVDCVLKLLQPGDEILAVDDIYGGAYRLFEEVYRGFGIRIKYIDTSDIRNVIDHISYQTKLVWLESPTNPTLKISDIQAISTIAHRYSALVVVDNTFASPALQKPLDLGADIIVHSATKYLAGHSDVIAGLVVTKDDTIGKKIKFFQNACGAVLGPFDSWLTIRGIETLLLRMEKQSENALKIAQFLETREEVDKVFYPGLKSHPNHEIAAKQQNLFGGIVSFSLVDDDAYAATKYCQSTQLFKLAESLGGVKSLICHPASMTHKTIPADIRKANGIQNSLIRLSVGIENVDDLIDDIREALLLIKRKKFSISFGE